MKKQQDKAEALLNAVAVAEAEGQTAGGLNYAFWRAWLNYAEFLTGEGCEQPERAVLSVLLLFPDQVAVVVELLPDPRVFTGAQERAVYTAMRQLAPELAARPEASDGPAVVWWWAEVAAHLGERALFPGGVAEYVAGLMLVPHNVTYTRHYCQLLIVQATQRLLLDQAAGLARAAYDTADLIATIESAAQLLLKLRARLEAVL